MEKLTLVFEPAEEGGFSAYVAEVPGVNSQGETVEEARVMVLEALQEMLEYRRENSGKDNRSNRGGSPRLERTFKLECPCKPFNSRTE